MDRACGARTYHLEAYPYRLEAGTLNLAGIADLSAGLAWIEERGREVIYRHELALLGQLQEGLADVPGVTLWGARRLDRRVPTLSMTVDHYDASDVGTLLDVDYSILTRTGLHCAPLIHQHHGTAPRGTVRFSVGPFDTEEHIRTAVRAIGEIAAVRFAVVTA